MNKITLPRLALLLAVVAITSAVFNSCTKKKEIWIYTSLYKEVVAEMDPIVKAAIPDAEIKWFQGGSENVASKLNAELAAGNPKADLILTSDPFWYFELKQNGKLLRYESPAAKDVPVELKDPDHAFVTVRIPMMVLGYNSEALKPEELPQTWKDLSQAKWKDKISIGSPLESGTSFTAVALLSKTFGWEYFAELRKLDLVAAGGNSSVITRIETHERPIGVVLLENILKAQNKGSPVRAVYPKDGSIPVPSPIAILQTTKHPELAKKIYDWFFSQVAQTAIVHSGMYSPLPKFASPANAKSWTEVTRMHWSPALLAQLYAARDQIKAKFSEVVLH
jgi:iron(III) transport system substrate-binding protein